jgi:hypothetical protein
MSHEPEASWITSRAPSRALLLSVVWLAAAAGPARAQNHDAGMPDNSVRTGPLKALPGTPGPHIDKIRALGENQWLNLGTPKADPEWGKACGRSWSPEMAFAPNLRGAFLFGEGAHGYAKPNGRYMDDLWFYDIQAHRWICLYPGTPVKPYEIKVNEDGFELGPDNRHPTPIGSMTHAYSMTTYVPELHWFLSMPCSGGFWKKRLKYVDESRMERKEWVKHDHQASPWIYDAREGHWDRKRTKSRRPGSGFGDNLIYISKIKKVFYRAAMRRRHGPEVWFYDPHANTWESVKPKGPKPPFGIDATSCYDPGSNRVYIGGGQFPVAKDNALWIFDIKTKSWINPEPEGKPGGSNRYSTGRALMHYEPGTNRVILFRYQGKKEQRGIFAYDPQKNCWETISKEIPSAWHRKNASGFYDPELNAHLIHVASDSRPNGSLWVYRFKN